MVDLFRLPPVKDSNEPLSPQCSSANTSFFRHTWSHRSKFLQTTKRKDEDSRKVLSSDINSLNHKFKAPPVEFATFYFHHSSRSSSGSSGSSRVTSGNENSSLNLAWLANKILFILYMSCFIDKNWGLLEVVLFFHGEWLDLYSSYRSKLLSSNTLLRIRAPISTMRSF